MDMKIPPITIALSENAYRGMAEAERIELSPAFTPGLFSKQF